MNEGFIYPMLLGSTVVKAGPNPHLCDRGQ